MQNVVATVTDPIADAFNISNTVKQKFNTNVMPKKAAFGRGTNRMFGSSAGEGGGFLVMMGGLLAAVLKMSKTSSNS